MVHDEEKQAEEKDVESKETRKEEEDEEDQNIEKKEEEEKDIESKQTKKEEEKKCSDSRRNGFKQKKISLPDKKMTLLDYQQTGKPVAIVKPVKIVQQPIPQLVVPNRWRLLH
ncbi:chromo domain-containing protein cec-1-like [Prorops nasuta]|uniref:chromo domain-containing protein cec-1-like n=1 Tax=Prorops nasuta TaxID=863751 RepID=UPI0034CF1593